MQTRILYITKQVFKHFRFRSVIVLVWWFNYYSTPTYENTPVLFYDTKYTIVFISYQNIAQDIPLEEERDFLFHFLNWLFNDDVSIETIFRRLWTKYGAVCKINYKETRSSQIKSDSVSLCPPQIPHTLTWDWTRAAVVQTQPPNCWAMARLLKREACSLEWNCFRVFCLSSPA
jgi:hypothetical protein